MVKSLEMARWVRMKANEGKAMGELADYLEGLGTREQETNKLSQRAASLKDAVAAQEKELLRLTDESAEAQTLATHVVDDAKEKVSEVMAAAQKETAAAKETIVTAAHQSAARVKADTETAMATTRAGIVSLKNEANALVEKNAEARRLLRESESTRDQAEAQLARMKQEISDRLAVWSEAAK